MANKARLKNAKTTTVNLPNSDLVWIGKEANRVERSSSYIFRQAIKHYREHIGGVR